MAASGTYRWSYAGRAADLPPALSLFMGASVNWARDSGWLLGLPHGVPLHVTVVKPEGRVRKVDLDRWVARSIRAMDAVDGRAGTPGTGAAGAAPRRPASVLLTFYLWGEKKRLPDKRGEPLTRDACNTGHCIRHSDDGRCEILVFRKEDAVKTLFHELLHAYCVGDWCNDDPVILKHFAEIGAQLRAPAHTLYRPAESVVDAIAMDMYGALFRTASAGWAVRKSDALRQRALRQFRGRPWQQDTHAMEYLVMRHSLIAQPDVMRNAFALGLQHPNRALLRRAFKDYGTERLLVTSRRVKGKSLCSSC
jgi:hypothetical protein